MLCRRRLRPPIFCDRPGHRIQSRRGTEPPPTHNALCLCRRRLRPPIFCDRPGHRIQTRRGTEPPLRERSWQGPTAHPGALPSAPVFTSLNAGRLDPCVRSVRLYRVPRTNQCGFRLGVLASPQLLAEPAQESISVSDTTKSAISRDPPEEVKRLLRAEVGFGCPVSTCREPFLTWHHFDPPWSVENHHRPDGMIALCVKHHAMADRGVFDKARLHNLKSAPNSVRDVLAKFEWARSKQLIRLGGVYTTPTGTFVLRKTGHFPAMEFNGNEDGLLELTFALCDERGRKLAEMNNNVFQASPPQLYDVQVDPGGTKLKIKIRKSDLILDLWSTRIKFDQLYNWLQDDWNSWLRFRSRAVKSNPNFRTSIEAYTAENPWVRVMGGNNNLHLPIIVPTESQDNEFRNNVIEAVKTYAASYLRDDDDFISILDCRRLLTHLPQGMCEVKNGFCYGWQGIGFGSIILRAGPDRP
jgi:hypothetical protein